MSTGQSWEAEVRKDSVTVVEQQDVIPWFIYISIWLGQDPGSAYSPEPAATGFPLPGCSKEEAGWWWLFLITPREENSGEPQLPSAWGEWKTAVVPG